MKWAILAIVSAALMVNAQESKPHSSTHKEDSAAKGADATDPTAGQTVVVVNQEAAQGQESNHDRKPPSYLPELLLPPNIPNLALVIVGIAGIITALCTLKVLSRQALSMRRQTTHLRRSVIFARRSANAARKSADALMSSERAHVDAEFTPLEKGAARHHLNVTNYGKSRAEVLKFSMAHISLKKGGEWPAQLPEGNVLERRKLNQMLPVGPKVPILEFDMRHYFSNEEISGDQAGLLQGRIDYLDVFGKDHYTEIVYRYVQDRAELENVPAYNKYT